VQDTPSGPAAPALTAVLQTPRGDVVLSSE
jgi:hypothetical protein